MDLVTHDQRAGRFLFETYLRRINGNLMIFVGYQLMSWTFPWFGLSFSIVKTSDWEVLVIYITLVIGPICVIRDCLRKLGLVSDIVNRTKVIGLWSCSFCER